MEIKRVLINQISYIEEVFNRFKNFKPPISSLPIAKGTIFSKSQSPQTEPEIEEMKIYPYRSALGCLSFVVGRTRPDITYAVNIFNQFQERPGLFHWLGLLRLLGYINFTKH